MHVEVEGENGFFPPIASNSYILHAIVSRRQGREKKSVNLQYNTPVRWDDGPNESSTMHLIFQLLLFFHHFLQNSLQKSL